MSLVLASVALYRSRLRAVRVLLHVLLTLYMTISDVLQPMEQYNIQI